MLEHWFMRYMGDLKAWHQWGHWLDTPQGICVLLSVPVCWLAAIVSFLYPAEMRPMFLSAGPLFFLMTPLLAFLCFLRFGQLGAKQYSSSLLTALLVLAVTGMPFYVPYLRSVP